jgi:copper(I)-binding protein
LRLYRVTVINQKEEPKMKTFIRIAFAVLFSLAAASPSNAHEVKAGDLLLTKLWARATPTGAKVGAAYFTIENNGSTPDRLLSVSSPLGKAEIHEMTMTNGVMTMRPLESGVTIAPGQKVTLAPGGIHLMFSEIKSAFKEGEMLPVVLQFEKAGQVDTGFHIRAVGAQGSGGAQGQSTEPHGAGHSGMKM